MEYGIFIQEHNNHYIYHENGVYTITTKTGEKVGTSNCLEGALVVASLGTKGVKDIFKKKRRG